MNPGPGTSWPDLHYLETEQVQLDVAAIIARGTWLRRKRLFSKVAAAALVVAIGPAAVVIDMGITAPSAPMAGREAPRKQLGPINGMYRGDIQFGPSSGTTHSAAPGHAAAKQVGSPLAGIFNGDLSNAPDQAVTHQTVTLTHRYGSMLAVAGARAGSGVWFAATAAQLTLFHLSVSGALKSWALPTSGSGLTAGADIGLAVTAAGVAWLGVASTLLRLDTRTARVNAWALSPQPPAPALPGALRSVASARPAVLTGSAAADSLAVSPDGHVAVATPRSDTVQVLNPRDGRVRQIRLPNAADQAVAVGYTENGTLGIGFEHPGRRRTGEVLLVERSGATHSALVRQPTSIIAYGMTGLLVGVSELQVVSAQGTVRPLLLPVDTDLAGVLTPPATLPGNRLGIALDTAILTFPATAASVPVASAQSELWFPPSPRCRRHRACPAGYGLAAADAAGDMWVVPSADPRTIELVSLR